MSFTPRLVVTDYATTELGSSCIYKLGDYFIGENCIAKIEKIQGQTLTLVNILDKSKFKDFTPALLLTTPWRKIPNPKLVTLLYV